MKVAVVARQLGYLISNKSTLENLRIEVKNLQDIKVRVEENFTWDSEDLEAQSSWLKRVNDIIRQVNTFSNYYEGKGACTNLLWRYQVGRQAQKMKQEISQLHEKVKLYQSLKPVEHYKGPKSRTDTITCIMGALKDPSIQIVGVWGLGGGGTTSLAKQIGEEAKKQNLFDVVVITTITKTNLEQVQDNIAAALYLQVHGETHVERINKLMLEQVQDDIAASLGLQFHGETHVEKVNKLRWRIKKEKMILIIIDDIWGELNAQEFDLEEFGVPLGDEYKRCKLLLTSGNLDFIKNMRGDPIVFQLEMLLKDEALSLFEKIIGDGDLAQDSEARSIMEEIVECCKGSTTLTFAMAKALRNKHLGAWQDALVQLKQNISPIKICYNSLESEELKYMFLLLTIRGRRSIHRSTIYLDMWTGLFGNLSTLEAAKKKRDSLLSHLKDYGLVVEDGKEKVKIDDLIWETAYSIAQKDLKTLIIFGTWPPEEWLRSLHFCSINLLSSLQVFERLQCPELEEIVLSTQNPSMQIPDSFFEETKLLKVIDIDGFNCSKLPISFGLLNNLQALSLHSCKLEDIAIIGELTNLQMLSLVESHIQHLPKQIGQLQKLLFLDLRDTNIQVIPPNVLSNLTSLEELYLRNSFCNWKVEGSNNEIDNACLKELINLHHLVYIEDLYVPDHRAWPVDLFFEKLKSYTIFIGDRWDRTHDGDRGLKTLKLKLSRRFQSEQGIKKMLKDVDVLYLDELNGVQNILSDLDNDGFPHLQSLIIQNNGKIKCIDMSLCSSHRQYASFNLMDSWSSSSSHLIDAFPSLQSLSLYNLRNLEHICDGPLTEKSFFKIKVIKLQKCAEMIFLFTNSMIKGLPYLANIEVSECKLLKAIVLVQGALDIEFPELHSLTLQGLPALTNFCYSNRSPYHNTLFHNKVSFPNLETMIISEARQLTRIWGGDCDVPNSFWKLKNVNITDCENLLTIFPTYLSKNLHNLKMLEVKNCSSMKDIFEVMMRDDTQPRLRMRLQLICINLVQLPCLKYVCHTSTCYRDDMPPVPIEFPEMDRVHLEGLPNLESFIPGNIIEWPSLENVVVNSCPKLEKSGLGKIEKSQLKFAILDNQEQVDIDTKVAHLFELSDQFSMINEYNIDGNGELSKTLENLQPSHLTNLTRFRVKNCDEKLIKFLSILMKRSKLLEYLTIEQCKTYEYLFEFELPYTIYFPLIKELILRELPNLTHIWKTEATRSFGLGTLQKIHIKSCPCLQDVIAPYAIMELHHLNELKIEACEMLEQVVGKAEEEQVTQTIVLPALSKVELISLSRFIMFHSNDYALEFQGLKTLSIKQCPQLEGFTIGFLTGNELSTTDGKSFSKLNELELDGCDKLVYVISSETLQELVNLETLTVSHCNTLKIIFKIQGEISHSTRPLILKDLTLIGLPNLIHIINKESIRFFQNMRILRVKQCKSLNWLVGPLMLHYMDISDCDALEKIIFMDDGEKTREITIFPELVRISLENLTNLSTLFPSQSIFPSLEILIIANCPALMTFAEESQELKDHLEPATSNYFFPNSLSFERMTWLQIINQDFEKLWHYNCPPKSFCELQYLNLSDNNKLSSVISSSMIMRFKNLIELSVHKCELLTEVFNLEDDKTYQNVEVMLPQLRTLALSHLSGLTNVWNKEPQVPFFQNMVLLHIVHCSNLESLFTPSSAKNLVQLKLLKLCNCEKMNEVISRNEDKNESITFPKVECLVLKDLPNLASFYPQGNGTFNWPKLQTVRVSNIPCMETFYRGHLNAPLLRTVFITFVKKCWQDI